MQDFLGNQIAETMNKILVRTFLGPS